MNRVALVDMFRIIDGWLLPEHFNLSSSEYANIKQRFLDNGIHSFEDRQAAYNIVQTTRFYFNRYVDKPNQSYGFILDAQRFNGYYITFIKEYYTKSLKNPKNKFGACYIATAVYGSYYAPKVIILREFRDSYLTKRKWGRTFIKLYYRFGPKLACITAKRKSIRNIVRYILNAFTNRLENHKG